MTEREKEFKVISSYTQDELEALPITPSIQPYIKWAEQEYDTVEAFRKEEFLKLHFLSPNVVAVRYIVRIRRKAHALIVYRSAEWMGNEGMVEVNKGWMPIYLS